jgi:hypothetical protein
MTIGVSLDDSQNIATVTDSALDFLKVVPESSKVDFNTGWTRNRHENSAGSEENRY